MATPDFTDLVAGQRAYFLAGATRPTTWRVDQLNALKRMITENRQQFYDALWHDLWRNKVDADLMDVEFNVKHGRPRAQEPAPLDGTGEAAHAAGVRTGKVARPL